MCVYVCARALVRLLMERVVQGAVITKNNNILDPPGIKTYTRKETGRMH
jgi:hypothetical protein